MTEEGRKEDSCGAAGAGGGRAGDAGEVPSSASDVMEDEATPLLGALPGDVLGASSGCAALDSIAINSSSTARSSSTRDASPSRRCSHRCILRTLWACALFVILVCIGVFVVLPNINLYHPSSKPAQRLPPGPPNVTVVNITSSTVRIAWSPPNITGSGVILKYRVQYGHGWNFTTVREQYIFTQDFTRLRGSTWYCFRVCAISSIGTGNYSMACVTTEPPETPAPVRGLVPINTTITSISIRWSPPHCAGRPCNAVEAQGMTVHDKQLRPILAESFHSLANSTGTSTSMHLQGLPPNTSLLIRLRAHNAVGFGGFSPPLLLQTNSPSAVAPGPCHAPKVVDVGPDSLVVQWTHQCETNGAQLLAVRLQMANSTGDFRPVVSSFLATQHSFSGLLALHTYCVRVGALTALGAGPWSNTTCVRTTKGGTPHAPSLAPVPVHVNGTSMTVNWTKPRDGGHPILRYQVEQDNWWDDQALRVVANTSAQHYATSFPLFPSAIYNFRIRACNAVGCGPFSEERGFPTASVGHCANSKDAHAYKATKSTMKPDIQGCLIGCVASGTSCVISCIQRKVGLTKDCANCWAQEGLCTLHNCILPCTNPKSKKCAQCSEEKCFPACVACSGVPRQYFPP